MSLKYYLLYLSHMFSSTLCIYFASQELFSKFVKIFHALCYCKIVRALYQTACLISHRLLQSYSSNIACLTCAKKFQFILWYLLAFISFVKFISRRFTDFFHQPWSQSEYIRLYLSLNCTFLSWVLACVCANTIQ